MKQAPSDIPPLTYYSFPNLGAIRAACADGQNEDDLNLIGLALAIGISPRLVSSFMYRPSAHYRTFYIGKRGGGRRRIDSPRMFLKVTQGWINDYLLWRLPTHEACHSYRFGKSIITNAKGHVGKNFVASLDIKDFFGSIRRAAVKHLLMNNKIGETLSLNISRLVTLNDRLPQGAPTSPLISNAFLYRFDSMMSAYCAERDLSYSRYADDVAISGNCRLEIEKAINQAEAGLAEYRVFLNAAKTRIASSASQQRVTGVIVNKKLQPPRVFRRRVRAMFHRANLDPTSYIDRLDELRGYLSYLQSFPELRGTEAVVQYRKTISTVERLRRTNATGRDSD